MFLEYRSGLSYVTGKCVLVNSPKIKVALELKLYTEASLPTFLLGLEMAQLLKRHFVSDGVHRQEAV